MLPCVVAPHITQINQSASPHPVLEAGRSPSLRVPLLVCLDTIKITCKHPRPSDLQLLQFLPKVSPRARLGASVDRHEQPLPLLPQPHLHVNKGPRDSQQPQIHLVLIHTNPNAPTKARRLQSDPAPPLNLLAHHIRSISAYSCSSRIGILSLNSRINSFISQARSLPPAPLQFK